MQFILLTLLFVYTRCDEHYKKRERVLKLEAKIVLGSNTTLSDKESIVNNCLMKHKFNEVDHGYEHPELYRFSKHYFYYKDKIRESKVYKIIKAMPKGAVLHVHDTAILGPDYLLNVTYMDHLYVCLEKPMRFLFSGRAPNATCDYQWMLLNNVRHSVDNITEFDYKIRQLFTLVVKNPDIVYPSTMQIWNKFEQYLHYANNLLSYKPVWEKYIYDSLESLMKDKIMYVELRSSLPKLYDLDGTVYDHVLTAKVYRRIIKEFIEKHPDFLGAKIIYSRSRNTTLDSLKSILNLVRDIKRAVPNLIIGFDLVGLEDLGQPLIDFAPILDTIKNLDFFFHAGETNRYGTSSDENLIDAVLLGSKRIGHAYALTKHPLVMKELVQKNIGLEVNVLSNSVMSLVRDVRNHPLSMFLSLGLPVVLSSDYPGIWEADPLSYDFYVAFVGVASKSSDLRMLKTLAFNSIMYSAMNSSDKIIAVRAFQSQWTNFIDKFNCSHLSKSDEEEIISSLVWYIFFVVLFCVCYLVAAFFINQLYTFRWAPFFVPVF